MTENNTKKPNFFILGAPKCGTTALSEYLREHPDIFFSTPKEANFFTNYSKGRGTYSSGEDYLEKCFSGSAGYKAVGEATTRYLRSPESVPWILEFNPEARFIVMVRNPVDMFQSLYWQRIYEQKEKSKTPEEAWRAQDECDSEELKYGKICKTGEQLERVYSQAPPKRILVLFFDDLKKDTGRVYRDVLQFLDLPDDGRKEFPISRKRKTTRSKFMRKLIKKGGRLKKMLGIRHSLTNLPVVKQIVSKPKDLSPEFKKELIEYFKEDIKKLERLTSRDLSGWRKL